MNDLAEHSVACADAKERFDDLSRARQSRKNASSRRGRRVAALVPIADLDFLEAIEDRLDAEEVQRAKAEARH